MMEGDTSWAITAGKHGVFLTPGFQEFPISSPDVEIVAILPDKSKMIPAFEEPIEDVDIGVYGFVFDPPLPEGSTEGGPLDYSNWRRRVWEPAVRTANLEGLNFHDLRRTSAPPWSAKA